MDPALSTIIIAVITGIFSIITLVIQKRQDKVINKIDEQTMFIEREKCLKQQLTQKEKECEAIIHEIMILILDTNLSILKNTQIGGVTIDSSVFEASENLKNRFNEASEAIKDITKQYELILEMTSEMQKKDSRKSKEK